jgi:lipopolysaccharide/colanic/teichoic acid biosynthesis glycosyltransferase
MSTWTLLPSPSRPLEGAPAETGARAWRGKRLFDVVVTLLLLVLFAPLLLLVTLAVRLTSPGPILFRQKRVGFGGTDFEILKFRTMYVDAEELLLADPQLLELYLAGNHKIAHKLDPRITPLGRLLRLLSLDELPQLWNVLRGDMSLIGPRPVTPEQVGEYEHLPHAYYAIRPGLTGLWQVSGRSRMGFPERAELDAFYYERCSPLLDVVILVRTVWAVLACRGAS